MKPFNELNNMERIEIMRLALETLYRTKELPKSLGDAVRKVHSTAETYAIYAVSSSENKQS